MSKLYRVIITERDVETGDVEEIHNEEHEGLMMMKIKDEDISDLEDMLSMSFGGED